MKEFLNDGEPTSKFLYVTKEISFKDIITCSSLGDMEEEDLEEQEDDEIMGDGMEAIRVEEDKIGGYECPTFVFSEVEEKRIQKPWRRGVIVKLLGRRIGYKALENRFIQMWVRKGVISIIDLSNDYYLVAFSHEDDKKVV